MFDQRFTLNCKGRLIVLDRPIVMGILNVTPDSFYVGSRVSEDVVLKRAEQMIQEGATILDIGGMSTRPGAEPVSEEEEIKRVIPVIQTISKALPEALLSIDTVKAKVAQEAILAGAHIINDVSAGKIDPGMYQTVAELKVPYVLMHMKGTPETMQQQAEYDDVVLEVLDFLIAEVGKLRALGVTDIIVDPGFGFGKTIQHNFQLLKKMHVFHMLEVPILAGLSRKSTIYKTLGVGPDDALNGTSVMNLVALQQGAKILRVHDPKEAKEVITLWEAIENS